MDTVSYRNLTTTSVDLSGVVRTNGGEALSTHSAGVVYSATAVNNNPQMGGAGCKTNWYSGTPTTGSAFWVTGITGLTPGTPYTYKAFATNSAGVGYSTNGTFTASCFDAPTVVSNGTASSVSFTWNDVGATQYVLRVWRDFAGSGGGGTTNVTDTIVATNLVATDTGYKAFTFTNTPSGAKYAGVTSKDANGYIQVKKNSGGIYTTGSGGILKNVKLNVGSGSYTYIVYANTTAYSSTNAAGVAISAGNVTTNIATTNGTSFTHAMIFANSGAQHYSSVEFVWEQASGGGGGTTTNYYGGDTGAAANSGVSVSVPMPGEYNWKLVAQGGGTCSQTVTGLVTAVAAGCGERWMVGPATAANNDSIAAAGSMGHYVVGETNTTPFYGAINVDTETDGWTAEFGYGTTTNGAGWEWFTAPKTWYDNPNTWHGSTNHVFGSTGTWYTAFRFSKDGCTYYTPKGTAWAAQHGTNALHADRYFEVKDTWAGWMGNSYVVAGGTWYNGHGTANPPAFHGQTIQTNSTGKVALAGEVQTYGSTAAQGPLAAKPHMAWEVRLGGSAVAGMGGDVALPWDRFDNNNNYYGRGGTGWTDQNLDFSNLAEGDYSLAVWFHGSSSNGATMYETNASSKVEYVATVPVRASLSRSVGSLDNFTATYPNAGGSKSFTVSGTNLTGNLTVTAPEGWEVSTTSATTGFGSTATLTPNSTTHKLAGGTVWVRLAAGASVDSHSGSVTVGRTGMSASVSVTVSGTVSAGTPTVTRVAETPLVSSATVTADVSAMGAVATVGFVYGTSESYGTGGTVSGGDASTNQVAAGTSGRRMTATLANLIAGTEYFYQWTVNNGSHSATLTNCFTTDCFDAGPGVRTNTASLSATLSWDRVDGADHYLVSMWTGGTGWAQVTNAPAGGWAGDYVIVAKGSYDYAMSNACNGASSGYMYREAVTVSSGAIAEAGAALVWTLAGNDSDGYTLYNASAGKYLQPATGTSMTWGTSAGTNRWMVSIDANGVVKFLNRGTQDLATKYYLQYNSQSPRFTCYTGTQQDLRLFAKAGNYATGTVGGTSQTLKDVVIAQTAAGVSPVTAAITSLAANTNTGYNWSVTAVGGGTCTAKTEGSGLKVEAAPAPRIEVLAGDPLAAVADSFDFGTCEVYAGTVEKTFTVTNAGNAALAAGQLGTPTVSGTGFGVVATGMATGLGIGATTTFKVTFDPTSTMVGTTSPGGTPTGTVTVPWGETTFTFGVGATVHGAGFNPTSALLEPATTEDHGASASSTPQLTLTATNLTGNGTVRLSDTTHFQVKVGSADWGSGGNTLTVTDGAVGSTVIKVRLTNVAEPGTYTATLTFSGGGAPDKVVDISGTVYPMPAVSPNHAETTIGVEGDAYLDFSDYHAGAPSPYTYTYTLVPPEGLTASDYEFDNGTSHIDAESGPGDVYAIPGQYGVFAFKVCVTNQNKKGVEFTWTVTVADAPTLTTNAVAVSQDGGGDWGASQTGTLDSGGADTTVTFEYRTGGGAWQAGTVLVNGVAGNTVSSNAYASSAAAVAGSTTNALTGGSTYDFRWTLESVGGTNVLTGTFFVPGDGLEFPGSWWMNGSDWITTNTTTRDLQFGGGNYYYTPARRLTGDQEFKALKSGTWYGNGAWMTGNHSEHTFTVNTNTANLHLCVTNTQAAFPSAGAGYYTIRGWDTGNGIQYAALYTENAPVTVTNGADNHVTAGTGDVTVTAELSGTKSASEKVYVRYTTDGWSTWSLVQMSVSGTTATGTIPGQGKGTTVEWYVLTSPHDAVGTYPDLCTLRGVKSGETNYCYRTEVTPPTVNSVTLGYEQAVLSWNLNAAGQNVMIVRYEGDSPSITAPTDGTTYPADQNLLGGRIVYGSWNGEGLTNGVAQGTHYTYVFYSVDGTTYSAGVTVDAGTTKTLGTPVVVMNGDGSMTGEVGGALNLGESYVVVRDTDGTFDAPAGSAAVPAVGAAWCGGTVVYTGTVASVGTEAEFTDTQPTIGCQEYHYWGFLRANGEDIWNMGGEGCGDTATAARPGATVVTATTTNTDGFALTWTPAERANGYLISIWTEGTATVNTSATYTVTSRTSVSTDGAAPAGSAATFANSYSTAGQATSNNTMRLQLTGYDGKRITGLKLSMKSNKDKGSGSLSVTSGSQTLLSFGNAAFSSASWNGAWSTNYVTIDFSSRLTATTVGAGETLQILISANQNSLYCESYEVIYEGTDSGTDYLSGYGADGGWITNGVAIGGMDPGTDYHYSLWAVGATTNCTGAETTNTVHTEGTAKPNPPGLSLSVTGPDTIVATVTRSNGEAWELWRFATEELAAAATEPPAAASAGVVRLGGGTTPATGSTTVTDTGLTGCTRYWYRAWEGNDLSGTPVWSNAREANDETTTVGTPTGLVVASTNAHGATLQWNASTGASGYDVEVWHTGMGWGSPKTVTYTFVTNNAAKYTVSGTAPAGSSATFSTPKWVNCVDAGQTNVMTLHGWGGVKITGLTMEMASWEDDGGADCGKGSFTMTSGGSTLVTVPDSTFDSTNWNGAWSQDSVDLPMRVAETVVGEVANVTLKLIGTEDSLFWESFTVTYEELEPGGRVPDWENGSGVGGVSVAVAGTNATVTGLTEATEYGWSVAAVGGCTGTAAEGPDFETTEVVPAPTVVTPLSAWVNGISGTVTGSADADTLWLYRFDDNEHAAAAVLPAAMGGTRVTNVTGGAGTWNFADTNLLGCKTYWYRAWLEDVIDGETFRSQGSTPVSGTTEMAVPEPKGTGAGTRMEISWANVPGATNYTLQVSDTTNTWTSLSSDAVIQSEEFAGVPTSESSNITSRINTYTTTSGWVASNAYGSAQGGPKMGASGTAGYLETPEWTGLSTNGAATFVMKSYGTDETKTVMEVKYGSGDWGGAVTNQLTTEWKSYSLAIATTGTAFKVRVRAASTSKQRFFIDRFQVTEKAGATAKGMFYDETATSPTTIDGLEIGANYFFRVTAHGEECDTTGYGWAPTEDAALLEVHPTKRYFGSVNKGQSVSNKFEVSNHGNIPLKFAGVDVSPAGCGFAVTWPTGAALRADIEPGGSREYWVTFTPTNSGAYSGTLRFVCNASNGAATEVATNRLVTAELTGTGYDPESADPEVIGFEIADALGTDGTVWDQSLALEEGAPVMKVTAWHASGIWTNLSASTNRATWTLRGPDGAVATMANGTALSGRPFTEVRAVPHGSGADGAEFSAVIPVLGAGRAARGPYTLEVTVKDATGRHAATATNYVPDDARSALLDDFTRADVVADGTGKLERGWTAIMSGAATASEAAIHDGALELYGELGTSSGAAGRIAVVRDMDDVGYATTPHEFAGSGSWGFHFRSEAQLHTWDGASMAGAFVLGSTQPDWLTASDGQAGLAVTLTTNGVQLASFTNSLLANADHPRVTSLGTGWTGNTAGKTLAVRVEFIAGKDAVDEGESDDGQAHDAIPAYLQLYVKEVSRTGGDPTKECEASDLVAQVEVPEAFTRMDLPYGGVVWAHGSGAAGAENSARFDDIHVPRMDGQSVPLRFWCVDDDTKAPTFDDFDVPAAIAAGTAATAGLSVTGTILDASGLWTDATGANAPTWETAAIAAPTWELWVNGTNVASGATTNAPDGNGAGTSVAVSFTIPGSAFDSAWRTTNCVVVVKAWDYDIDRPGDSKEGRAEYRFTLCDSTPTAPAWATVEADGAEMAVVRWAWTNGAQYVVVRGDAEFGETATPPQGTLTAPTAGLKYAGLGTVAYAGSGDNHLTNGWTAREVLVAPGSTNYFAVYGMTGDGMTGHFFSSPTRTKAYTWTATNAAGETVTHWATAGDAEGGQPAAGSVWSNSWPMTTVPYEPGEGIDAFAYRTSVSYPTNHIAETPATLALAYGYEARAGTGSGWSTNEPTGWQGDTNKWKIHDGSLLTGKTGYPTPVGNKLYWQDTSSGSSDEAKLTRWLDAPEGGDFFVAAVMNYNEPYHDTPATNKWIEIALVDEAGNDIASFGKPRWDSYNAAIQYNGGQYGGYTQYTLNSGHGNDYIVVGQLSRTDSKFRMWVYWGATNSSDKIPEVFSKKTSGGAEVSIEDATTAMNTVRADCNFVGTPADVAGIQLRAGSESGKELGHVYFDEVRFAATWEELFLFNEPEVETFDLSRPAGSGKENGTNSVGLTQWLVSDGALAHGDVGLNATFELYHRTGIQSASFDILSGGSQGQTNLLRVAGTNTTASTNAADANVSLRGTPGAVYGEWTTPEGGATGVAIPTNWISLESNYVLQVSLHSTGGREATATSATDNMGGGATDLFFGEYGEGCRYDKYVELYNGTGRSIDLSQYYLARANKGDDTNYSNRTWFCHARITNGTYMLPHKTTVVLINKKMKTESDTTYRYDKMVEELQKKRCRFILMTNDVLDAGGSVPIVLLSKAVFDEADAAGRNAFSPTNKPWLDACGDSTNKVKERFIMSRKADASPLPRANLPVTLDEWDYRNWSVGKEHDETDDYESGYGDFITTAGGYDRAIGLGGTMEFRVYDDDEEPPSLAGGGQGGGLRLKESTNFVASTAGDRTYVMGGWSFTNWDKTWVATNLTAAQCGKIAEMWPQGLTTNGGISWASQLGESITNVVKGGSGKGQTHVEFDGSEQTGYGALTIKADTNKYVSTAEVWIGFDLDVQDLAEPMVSFGYAGGTSGFSNGCVKVSATGAEGSFTVPNENWKFTPITGSGSTWAEWSQSLEGVLPEGAGHVWFRVCVWNYKNGSGSCWLDNFRVEGNPRAVRVTDQELADTGVVFEVRVRDESGVDAGAAGTNTSHGATFEAGLGETWYRRAPGTTNLVEGAAGATATNGYTSIQWTLADGAGEKAGGFGKDTAQEWYTKTQDGKGQLKVTVGDLDDDRANDQSVGSKNFGMLVVDDDDDSPPQIRMKTMKPRLDGVVGEWLFKEKAWGSTDEMDGVEAGSLGVCTTNGALTKPRASLVAASTNKPGVPDKVSYAVYQTGWQAGSKYWTTTLRTTGGGKGKVTSIRFWSKVGSVNAPTGWELWTKTGDGAAVQVEAGSSTNGLLEAGTTCWQKQSDEAAEGTPIGVWREYRIPKSGNLNIELPTNGAPVEIRLLGKGAAAKGIGASWFLWDLKMEGELEQSTGEGEESYTYKTDHEVATGEGEGLLMEGSVWDEESGLAEAPTWSMTEGITGSGPVTFTDAGVALTSRTNESTGAFAVPLPVSTTYAGLELKEYRGTITAKDADNDRNSAADGSGVNYDSLTHTGKFGFTVVDQDVTRPTAPTDVAVNGVAVGAGTPDRLTVTWTNSPEFTVSFGVAADQDPTGNWGTSWTNANVCGEVKKESAQSGTSGIGEYRVSLSTNAADGVGYSVATTNGALANGGFEETAAGKVVWEIGDANGDNGSGINKGQNVGGSYPPPAGGLNSCHLRAHGTYPAAEASQILPLTVSNADYTVEVDAWASVWRRNSTNSLVYAKIQLSRSTNFSGTNAVWTSPVGSTWAFNEKSDATNTWLRNRTIGAKTVTVPAGVGYMRFALFANNAAVQVDDVALSVKAGDGTKGTMRYVAPGPEAQGLNAKHLFAMDGDHDRIGDALDGAMASFHTAYDVTPPTKVRMGTANPDETDDPTTQFDVTWFTTGVGPDDTGHTNYAKIPTNLVKAAGANTNDVLSPWKTYRFYHAPFDADLVPTNDTPTSMETGYIYTNFIATGAYKGWAHTDSDSTVADPSAAGTTNYLSLTNKATAKIRLYDLENDQHYAVVVVGVDSAGNEGAANINSWATNNTIKFMITQGVMVARSAVLAAFPTNHNLGEGDKVAAGVYWNASKGTEVEGGVTNHPVKRDYDLIEMDGARFNESTNNEWQLVQTVKSDWFADAEGLTNGPTQMRFYRAAYKDRWRPTVTVTNGTTTNVTSQRPLMSEDVYAMSAVKLTEGVNFVSLHGYPYTNTLAGLFGEGEAALATWPTGENTWDMTQVMLYGTVGLGETDGDVLADTTYGLDTNGTWWTMGWKTTGDVTEFTKLEEVGTNALDSRFFTHGFGIQLPELGASFKEFETNVVNQATIGTNTVLTNTTVGVMTWHPILRVPTNGVPTGEGTPGTNIRTTIIRGGMRTAAVYNFVSYCLPANAHPKELQLTECGFAASTAAKGTSPDCDILYPYDSVNKEPRNNQAMYVDANGTWRYVGGNGTVSGKPLRANDALLIVSQSKGRSDLEKKERWTWTYSPTNFYTLPTRFGGW